MQAAIWTTLFFALSGVTGQKVAVRLGPQWGNFVRLVIAGLALGSITYFVFPESLDKTVFAWFFVSGLIGFGLGDTMLFAAYQRLGSRLTILINLCFAPISAMIIEWIWLGSTPVWRVLVCVTMILTGVGIALFRLPGAPLSVGAKRQLYRGRHRRRFWLAWAQGWGAVVSRKAEQVASGFAVEVSGISAAFQRILGGVLVAGLVVLALKFLISRPFLNSQVCPVMPGLPGWMLGAALFGPVIGVSCFQWALQSQESGVVLAVVALTPIVMIPIVAFTEKDLPGIRSILGACLAVSGVVLLYLWGLE